MVPHVVLTPFWIGWREMSQRHMASRIKEERSVILHGIKGKWVTISNQMTQKTMCVHQCVSEGRQDKIHLFGLSQRGRVGGDCWGQTTGKGPRTWSDLCFSVPKNSHASLGLSLHTEESWKLRGFSLTLALIDFVSTTEVLVIGSLVLTLKAQQ